LIISLNMSENLNNHNIIKEISFSLLTEGKSIKVRADGYSMYPAIKPGSIIYIDPISSDSSPGPGEIIAWKRESGFVLHRLVRIIKKDNKTVYFTRGDSCAREDQPITFDQIAGRIVRVENREGEIAKYNKSVSYKPNYYFNRLIVLGIHIFKKIF